MESDKITAKLELAEIYRELMPNGKPAYLEIVKYPMIYMLLKTEGFRVMHKVIFLLIKDFCNSFNVVRNMNEEQMIEAATMLIDECDNFRLEDYAMMFQVGKRGELFEVHDRIDLQVITAMLDKYWELRHEASEQQWEKENKHFETMGEPERMLQTVAVGDAKLLELASGFSSAINHMKDFVEEKIGNREERERLRQIEIEDTKKIQEKKSNNNGSPAL